MSPGGVAGAAPGEEIRLRDSESAVNQGPDVAAHLAYAFQNTPSFLAILIGRELFFELVNESYSSLIGHRGVLGKRISDALPELRGQGLEKLLSDVMDSGVPFVGREMLVQLQQKAGSPPEERVIDFTFLPLPGIDGTPAGVIAHGHDVTDFVKVRADLEQTRRKSEDARERAERLLRLTEALSVASTLSEVTDAAVAGSTQAFPDSVGTVVARCTEDGQALEILAVSDMPGRVFENWRRFPLSSDAPLAEVVRTGELIPLESVKDWEDRYPQLVPLLIETGHRAQIVAPLVVGGTTFGSIGVAFATDRRFTDAEKEFAVALAQQCAVAIERARLFETEKTARAEAENANRVKSDFLASISHELRTPLNAIGGYAELIELGIHGPVTDDQRTALGRIQASQKHLQGLLSSVLEFSQIEAGATRYALRPVRLSEVLDICEALTAPQMRAKGLIYNVEGALDGLLVNADPEKLRQILLNLLSNAVKYNDVGGVIEVRVGLEGEQILIAIADSGEGIEPEKLDLVFEPFVQVLRTGRVRDGVGLGLAISRNLARGMGGDLTAESVYGEGSTFVLSVPRALD